MNYRLKSLILTPMNILYAISPKLELQLMFYLKQGYKLRLDNPRTYNEKINWQKLYYHDPRFSVCSDKFLVRRFVEERGCGHILNTLLWEGFDPADIPFDSLPEKFVIKVTHGSGFNILCRDKSALNREETVKKLRKWLKTKYIRCYGESWYGKEKPRVIVESFLESGSEKPLFDYKFFCYDGKPKYVYVDTWKDGAHHINMYDVDFTLRRDVSMGYPTDMSDDIRMPACYEEMLKIAETLSAGFPHVRVDLYSVKERPVFGEMTFSKGAGFDKILPYSFDEEMGADFHVRKYEDQE